MAATSLRRARIASYASRAAATEGSSVVAKSTSRSAGQTRCSVRRPAREVGGGVGGAAQRQRVVDAGAA